MEEDSARVRSGSHNFLFIASDFKPRPGGIATYIDNLARGLRRLGHEVKVLAVVTPDEVERIAFLERYEEWVCPFPVIHDQRPRGWLASRVVSLLEIVRCAVPHARRILDKTAFFRESSNSINMLDRALNQQQPSMIVFGHLDLKLYPLALYLNEKRLPYGIIAHDSEVYRYSEKKNDLVRRGMMINGARWIAANSRHTKALVEMWNIPSSKIKLVHPPIAEEAITRSEALECTPGNREHLNLVTICRLVSGKGIDIVIRALKILSQKEIPYRYSVAGEGPEKEFLLELVGELGLREHVNFIGSITESEKWQLLQNSDVYVMASRVDPKVQHEGFGISFIEAAAFGVPGIGSRGGGIPDAVLDGETGILIREESPDELAEALISLYRNPHKRREMGLVAMKRARTQFSPVAIANCFREQIGCNQTSSKILDSESMQL